MKEAISLLEEIKPQLLQAFSSIPAYGTLGITVILNAYTPVRFEYNKTESHKLLTKVERGNK